MGNNVFSDPKFTPTCTTRSATSFKRPYGYDRTAHTANNSERCSVSAFSDKLLRKGLWQRTSLHRGTRLLSKTFQ